MGRAGQSRAGQSIIAADDRVFSVMEQRRLARLAAAGYGSNSHVAQGGGLSLIHHVALLRELVNEKNLVL